MNIKNIVKVMNFHSLLRVDKAKKEAENIKSVISDDTTNKLAKYIHKVLGLTNLDCDYDINKEKCRCCARRTSVISN